MERIPFCGCGSGGVGVISFDFNHLPLPLLMMMMMEVMVREGCLKKYRPSSEIADGYPSRIWIAYPYSESTCAE